MNDLTEEQRKALEEQQRISQELYDNNSLFKEIVDIGSVLNDLNGRILSMIFNLSQEIEELKGKVNENDN